MNSNVTRPKAHLHSAAKGGFALFLFWLTFYAGVGGAENSVDLPSVPGVAFVAVEDPSIPWLAWGENHESGFSFMYDRIGNPQDAPTRILVLFPGDPSSPCFLEPSLRAAVEDSNTLIIQPILEESDRLVCGREAPLIDLCRSLEKKFQIPPEKVFLVGETGRSQTALTLASNHRMDFGGVIVWEGDPRGALPTNLVDTSIAVLGDRSQLGPYEFFLQVSRNLSVPIKMNTYWGDVGEFDLTNDLKEILEWMSKPEARKVGRRISHATYLPRYGTYGWVRIVQLVESGNPGKIEAHWTKTSSVEFKAEGIKKFRVKIDSTFDRLGKRIYFSVGNLSLPVTINRNVDAIEFEYIPSKDRWTARFGDFFGPDVTEIVANEVAADIKEGEEIPDFGSFTRLETGADCAWGGRFPSRLPKGRLLDEDLYRYIPPIPIVSLNLSLSEIARIHDWQIEHPDFGLELSFPPGFSADPEEHPDKRMSVSIPLPLLESYGRANSQILPDSLVQVDNLQHLLGLYLSREDLSLSASL